MEFGISHDRADEDSRAKAAWFQSLSLQERMELLCEFTDMILENNPGIIGGVAAILHGVPRAHL